MFNKLLPDFNLTAPKDSEIKSRKEDKGTKILGQYYSTVGTGQSTPVLCTLRSVPLEKKSDSYFVLDYNEEVQDAYKAIYISVWLDDKDSKETNLSVTLHHQSSIAFPRQELEAKSHELNIYSPVHTSDVAKVYVYKANPDHIKLLLDILKKSLCPHRYCLMPDIGSDQSGKMVRLDLLFTQLYEHIYANYKAKLSSQSSFNNR